MLWCCSRAFRPVNLLLGKGNHQPNRGLATWKSLELKHRDGENRVRRRASHVLSRDAVTPSKGAIEGLATPPLYLYSNSTRHASPHPPHLPHIPSLRLRCHPTNTPDSSPLASRRTPTCPAASIAHLDALCSSRQTQSHPRRQTPAHARSSSLLTRWCLLRARLIRIPHGVPLGIVSSRMFFAYSVRTYRLSPSDRAMLDFV